MTQHQMTQSLAFDVELPAFRPLRLLTDMIRGAVAARRLEAELAALDHRERADLAWRR